jgi:hypothetical protein
MAGLRGGHHPERHDEIFHMALDGRVKRGHDVLGGGRRCTLQEAIATVRRSPVIAMIAGKVCKAATRAGGQTARRRLFSRLRPRSDGPITPWPGLTRPSSAACEMSVVFLSVGSDCRPLLPSP